MTIHLSLPRGGNTCGTDGPSDSEINNVTCTACLDIHDTVTKEASC